VSVVVLDRRPDVDLLFERVDRASRLVPRFRHKVVQAPMRLANPRWVQDGAFELGYHLRRIAAPAPGRLADVLDYACQTGMSGFDRQRALWEFTLVEGLEDDQAALVMKVHHALTDGIGGMEMAKSLFDLEVEPAELAPTPPAAAGAPLSSIDLVRDALSHDISRVTDFTRDWLHATPAGAGRILRHPGAALRRTVELVRSLARTVQPVNTTLSPLMQARRLSWHYDALSVPLEALRRAARQSGLTLNDAFLGAVSGGLLRYHERYGAAVDELRLTMPISIRKPDDPVGGNRITLMRFKVPVGLRDPITRMHRIHELSLQARCEPAIDHTNAIAGALNLLPRGIVGSMLKHVDFLASNVPGIDVPVYLAGARVAQWYAFGPTIGAALNATLVSYNGTCYIGLNVDTEAVPDSSAMLDCLRDGFDEVMLIGSQRSEAGETE
jgi:diacylglycerol O-acyltransferase / wax synthase